MLFRSKKRKEKESKENKERGYNEKRKELHYKSYNIKQRSLYQSIISEVIQVNKKLASCYFQVILSLSLFNFNKNSLEALLETLNTGSYYGNVSHCPHNFRILYAPYYAIYGKRISFYLKIKLKKNISKQNLQSIAAWHIHSPLYLKTQCSCL